MIAESLRESGARLRALAEEIESTALGSSRIDMYRLIAQQIRAEAASLERLADTK